MSATARHTPMHQGIEPLEARIAPATIYPTIKDAELAYDKNPLTDTHFVTTKVETPILLTAGQVLTTGVRARDGVYMLFVEKGSALVFTTDFNNNNQVDFNEITGIAASDGLRLISFVDINGDIVTNLDADGTLSDSNNNATGDDPFLRGDGKVLNKSRIEKIELRSLTAADITDQDPGNNDLDGGSVDDTDVAQRLAFSSYSIHGSIFAGNGVGLSSDPTSGILIDSTGKTLQSALFTGIGAANYFLDFIPSIGAIKVGTAASGEYFSFSISKADDIQGNLRPFVPTNGQAGADIVNVRAADTNSVFSVSQFVAGDGGAGAPGGSILNIRLNNDINGGYFVKAGDGGRGPNGGAGGSIINFSDRGSITSQVTLQSGTGGEGSTGTGGAGGLIVLAGEITTLDANGNPVITEPFNVNGGVSFLLGDGGDGFRAGGAGASMGKGIVTAPETPASYGRNAIGTTHDGAHDPVTGKLIAGGSIGRTHIVDFDQDGLGDFLFTSSDSEQLIVQFGDGSGGFRLRPDGRPDRIYIDAPISAEAITVGDFNGDGHQDIAAASQAPGNFGGIFVYLSKWEDANVNGLTSDEDVNHNGVDEFQGFLTPRQSPLPALASGDPDGGLFFTSQFQYLNSGHAISDIEAGDFNGDGFTDIAVSTTYVGKGAVAVGQVVIFMSPDVEDGRPTGEFYADFGAKRVAQPPQGANPFLPFFLVARSGVGQIEATALSIDATHDVILALPQANNLAVGSIQDSGTRNYIEILDNSAPSIAGPTLINDIVGGGVDTNRLLPTNVPNINNVPVTFREFTVADINNDGKADFVALSEAPASYIVAWTGDGLGGATEATLNKSDPAQNEGIYLGNGPGGSFNLGTNFLQLRTIDGDLDGKFNDVAILNYSSPTGRIWTAEGISFQPTASALLAAQPGGSYLGIVGASGFRAAADSSVIAFDVFLPLASAPALVNFVVGIPRRIANEIPLALHSIESSGPFQAFPQFIPISERFFHFEAGDGGDSLIGRGGAGGSLGSGTIATTIDTTTGVGVVVAASQLQLTLPANREFNGFVDFITGTGGDGFTRGGAGGNLQSVVARFAGNIFHSDVTMIAGDGGLGVAATGGKGGSIIAVSMENGISAVAGRGGDGRTGGAGGDILGNGIKNLFDSRSTFFEGTAGLGGNGVRRGGDGGVVANFKSGFNLVSLGGVEGLYIMRAGNGGTAVSGPGGSGGSITNITPIDEDNFFGGDILLQAGIGGNGNVGGAGGNISNFVNGPDSDELPKVLSVIAGAGGNGTSGPGGAGGSVSNIIAPMKGVLSDFSGPPATVYGFNRILAGNGGSSAASAGGNGGSVSSINSKSEGGPFAVVAGAGGPGLIRGGDGGNASNILIDVGGTSIAKLLVVAGNGGDAGAFIANPDDTTFQNQAFKAFGGRVGRGGNGGSIGSVFQSGGIQSRTDLVAGNGGDTVFFGGVADSLSFVGKGGSIRNVTAAGTLGNILPNVAIVSYFDYRIGQTMTDFVTKNLRDEVVPGEILDNVGNVGLVVGAAGRLKRVFNGNTPSHVPDFVSTPANKGMNGDLIDIRARGIMAAVAGNVDRIAAIQNVRNIVVTSGFEIGVDKTVGDPVNYLDKFGNPVPEAVKDGTLIDGAIVSSRQPVNAAGKPVNLPGNGVVLS